MEINREQIIKLIKEGINIDLIALELDIPIEELQELKNNTEKSEIAKTEKDTNINNEEREIPIHQKKNSNIKKKEKSRNKKQNANIKLKEKQIDIEYNQTIKKYKDQIKKNPQNSLNARNMLAFTYFKAGRLNEAKEELLHLIEEYNSFTAYKQMIHIENTLGNTEDAKLWAYEALDKYPDSIPLREQIIAIARQENDREEIINQIKEIVRTNPENKKYANILEKIMENEEREINGNEEREIDGDGLIY